MSKKLGQKLKVRIRRNIENESCSTTLVDNEIVYEPFPEHKNSPLGHQKVKIDLKIESKSNVRIERNIENESCSTIISRPRNSFLTLSWPQK